MTTIIVIMCPIPTIRGKGFEHGRDEEYVEYRGVKFVEETPKEMEGALFMIT